MNIIRSIVNILNEKLIILDESFDVDKDIKPGLCRGLTTAWVCSKRNNNVDFQFIINLIKTSEYILTDFLKPKLKKYITSIIKSQKIIKKREEKKFYTIFKNFHINHITGENDDSNNKHFSNESYEFNFELYNVEYLDADYELNLTKIDKFTKSNFIENNINKGHIIFMDYLKSYNCAHTVSIIKKKNTYYYYDSNNKNGEYSTENFDDLNIYVSFEFNDKYKKDLYIHPKAGKYVLVSSYIFKETKK